MAQATVTSKNFVMQYCPEILLLLYCARTRIEPELATAIRSICSSSIDWEEVLQLAEQHGVIPLLYRTLSAVCPEEVPNSILQQLRLYHQTNALRNQVLTTELLNILDLLHANNIPVIPYKGPVLASMIYNDLSLRQFSDLDILVKKQDVLKTKQVLCTCGYQSYTPMTAEEEAHLLKSSYQYKFTRKDSLVNLLELHWQIARSYPVSMEEFNPFGVDLSPYWDRLEPRVFCDRMVSSFSLQDLLVLLCIHGAKDRWRSLKSLCDLNELLSTYPELDLLAVLARAKNPEQFKVLSLAFVLVNRLFGTPLPADIVDRIHTESVVQLADQVQKELFDDFRSHWSDRLRWHLQLIEGFQNRVRYSAWFVVSHYRPPAWLRLGSAPLQKTIPS